MAFGHVNEVPNIRKEKQCDHFLRNLLENEDMDFCAKPCTVSNCVKLLITWFK